MDPLDRYSVTHEPPPVARGRETRSALIIGVLTLLLFAVVVGLLVWRGPRVPQPAEVRSETPATNAPRRALGTAVDAVELPPLDLSDPLVRELLGRLSSRPEIAAWLATDNLIRGFVVSVDNVASGATPARHLRVLAPAEAFQAQFRNGRIYVDRRAYERYSGVAETVSSLDPVALARLYSTLKPRLQDAYRELGHPAGDIDVAIEQAIVRLLETPVPRGDVVLTQTSVVFRYAEPDLESLTPAQKQLLRMGPDNMRLVQRQLWAIARELGIPAERLPAPNPS